MESSALLIFSVSLVSERLWFSPLPFLISVQRLVFNRSFIYLDAFPKHLSFSSFEFVSLKVYSLKT